MRNLSLAASGGNTNSCLASLVHPPIARAARGARLRAGRSLVHGHLAQTDEVVKHLPVGLLMITWGVA